MLEISLSEFADRINEVMPVFVREFSSRQANELSKGKITVPQFLVLVFLHKQRQAKMTELANCMHVTTAAMTGIIDRIVRDGYVSRRYDPADRRIIRIELTAKGEELVKRINQQRRKMIINIFGKLPESDRRNYLRILLRLKDILSQEAEKQ
jgi:DNA-binding MarR family transcriptional regulator